METMIEQSREIQSGMNSKPSVVAQKFADEIGSLKELMVSMPWENPEFYSRFLEQTFYFVRHSTRLLAASSAHAAWDEEALHRRSIKHISEERGHDLLALSDRRAITEFDLGRELPETRNLYETQYFKIDRFGSTSLLGYILALEGVASLIVPLIMPRLKVAYEAGAYRFLQLHAEEDPDHVEKAMAEIESLSEEKVEVILANLAQSCRNYAYFLRAIEESINKQLV